MLKSQIKIDITTILKLPKIKRDNTYSIWGNISNNIQQLPNTQKVNNTQQLPTIQNVNNTQQLSIIQKVNNIQLLPTIQKVNNTQQLSTTQKVNNIEQLPTIQKVNNIQPLPIIHKVNNIEQLPTIQKVNNIEQLPTIHKVNIAQKFDVPILTTEIIFPSSYNIIEKTNKVNIKHPYIKFHSSPPNNNDIVNNIDELFPVQVNLTKFIRNNGMLQMSNINILSDDQILNIKNIDNIIDNTIIGNDKITKNMTIKQIIQTNPPYGWEQVFQDASGEYDYIDIRLNHEESIYGKYIPGRKNIFRAFHLCPLHNIKVVIIGQDPYHTTINNNPIANGLSFSSNYDISPQLKNIYKELSRSMPKTFNYPSHGDLSSWARQGILMLNTCLTVNENQPGSHINLWKGFIGHILRAIEQVNAHCIFVLWGTDAQNISKDISTKAIQLTSSHPGPRSFKRGFYGCNHFVTINENLIDMGHVPIDWNL
uniref:Uracil-DNA glycosylase n=1 Tax=Pithovirus LCPAC102 TaxID=2506587 RepID=A0A481Z2Z9_9VIRU|nr:MAG: uracil-DNA glycosylase [Pithovirus LCPAC102]